MAIDNCGTPGNLANGCSACNGGLSSTLFYAFTSPAYNKCVVVLTPNCFIADIVTPGRCAVCMPKYFLNYDGYCESLYIYQCSSSTALYSDFNLLPEEV